MTELERKALLGDKEAQKECTEKGLLLPCPICNGVPARHKISEDFLGVGYKTNGFNVFCLNCRTSTEYLKSQNEACERWNTRQAPPIGRCGVCRWFAGNNDGEWYGCQMFQVVRINPEDAPKGNNYCSYFEPRCEKRVTI